MRVALINTNRIHPPIAPIGLDYIAQALAAAGHEPALLDLCWEGEWDQAIARFFADREVGLVGLSLRNTDDCMLAGQQSFLDGFAAMVSAVRQATDAPIAVGGVGFSVMPEQVLARCPADFGIWGEGDFAFPQLAGLRFSHCWGGPIATTTRFCLDAGSAH